MKCDVCGKNEDFKELKGLRMCLICYHTNRIQSKYVVSSKAQGYDKRDVIRLNKDNTKDSY